MVPLIVCDLAADEDIGDEKLDGYVGYKSRRLGEEVKRSGGDVSVVEEHCVRGLCLIRAFPGLGSEYLLGRLTCDN